MTEETEKPKKPEVYSPEEWEKMSSDEQEQARSYYIEGFASPLLPPEVLQRYGNVIPGLDKKLVEWAEAETQHRRALDREAFDEAKKLRNRSSLLGPIVSIVGLILAALVTMVNDSWTGTATASVIAIVAVGGPFAARILATRFTNGEEKQD
ncbi:MAG: DUF2335 domain-containing protein [Pseudomonadota bacterium]